MGLDQAGNQTILNSSFFDYSNLIFTFAALFGVYIFNKLTD